MTDGRQSAESVEQSFRDIAVRRNLVWIGLLVVLIGAAVWFSNAQGVEQVAAEGSLGIRIEQTISGATAVRNRAAQALVVARAESVDLASEDELGAAVASVVEGQAELGVRVDVLSQALDTEAQTEVGDALERMQLATDHVISAISSADLTRATVTLTDDLDPSFVEAVDLLVAERTAVLELITVARDTSGRVATAARLIVALIIPLGAVVAFRALSRRDERRRRLAAELDREREMVAARDELIANLSHELRTPLTGILGFAQAAATDESLGEAEIREFARLVSSEADELARMVDDLITAARDEHDALAFAYEVVDPRHEVDAILVGTTSAVEPPVISMESGKVWADPLRVRQIVRNLISNAVKYGGTHVEVIGRPDQQSYVIDVRDDGQGVPDEILDRLFERFIHEGDSPLTKGSVGLGLAIAQRLARLMGGDLGYRRDAGWTIFSVTLPAPRDDSE